MPSLLDLAKNGYADDVINNVTIYKVRGQTRVQTANDTYFVKCNEDIKDIIQLEKYTEREISDDEELWEMARRIKEKILIKKIHKKRKNNKRRRK